MPPIHPVFPPKMRTLVMGLESVMVIEGAFDDASVVRMREEESKDP
jgi:hypothetical protein